MYSIYHSIHCTCILPQFTMQYNAIQYSTVCNNSNSEYWNNFNRLFSYTIQHIHSINIHNTVYIIDIIQYVSTYNIQVVFSLYSIYCLNSTCMYEETNSNEVESLLLRKVIWLPQAGIELKVPGLTYQRSNHWALGSPNQGSQKYPLS